MTGDGYDIAGTVRTADIGDPSPQLHAAILPFALCNDARTRVHAKGAVNVLLDRCTHQPRTRTPER
ncbi:hypothetical protein ACFW2D_36810 [Streptomyces sp. NPDC058914]|uniref:hypothetical protein n=1 Tax=Streptomyces sp. NPDC058914 TaxID=3346671 RepID=UPI0036A63BEC